MTDAEKAVIAAARRVEERRTDPPHTFDIGKFWFAIKELTTALSLLDQDTPETEEMHAFLNRTRSLWNIDGWLLPELTKEQQQEFMLDPHRYFTHTDRVQTEAIWREVQKRQRRTTP